MTAVRLTVNGRPTSATTTPRTHLADFLRESQGLTGTHIGCEHGVCGACTVEINGEISRACITYAVACEGATVRTIEGFDDDALMVRLRAAFIAEHALQCGYCTPGMLIAARDLIRRRGTLSEGEIRVEMSGNLCRCTGYAGIVHAIARVMAEVAPERQPVPRLAEWLGPAPGPTATGSPAISGASEHIVLPLPLPKISNARSAAGAPSPKIKVATGQIRQDGATTRLTQSFVISQPIDRVWARLAELETVIMCMPGAALDGAANADGKFNAHIALRFGPIRTTFAGDGVFSRDDGLRTCTVRGRGRDRGGPSSVTGDVVYRATAVGDASTQIEADIGYSLTGPLAQFGRPALVIGLVTHVGETFAANLDAALSGRASGPHRNGELGLLSIVWSFVRQWFDRRIMRS